MSSHISHHLEAKDEIKAAVNVHHFREDKETWVEGSSFIAISFTFGAGDSKKETTLFFPTREKAHTFVWSIAALVCQLPKLPDPDVEAELV